MPPKFQAETKEKEKPTLLIYGNNILIPQLLRLFTRDFKVILISDLKQDNISVNEFYTLSTQNNYLIARLKEKISYAIVFLERESDKALFKNSLKKFEKEKTKVTCVIQVQDVNHFYDVIEGLKRRENFAFLLLGDLFGENIDPESSDLARFVQNAMSNRTLMLTGDDLSSVFPIYEKDAIQGINQSLFGLKKKKKIYYLFYTQPQTVISMSHLIRRVEPDLDIKFTDSNKAESLKSFDHIEKDIIENLSLRPEFLDLNLGGFEKSVKKMWGVGRSKRSYPKSTSTKKIKLNNLLSIIKFYQIFKLLFSSLATFLIINLLFFITGIYFLRQAANSFDTQKFQNILSQSKKAKFFLSIVEPTVSALSPFLFFIDRERQFEKKFNLLNKASDLFLIASDQLPKIRDISSGREKDGLSGIISNFVYVYFEIERLKVDEKDTTKRYFDKDLSKIISTFLIMESVLGMADEKNYLILFQNNGELRPTGGFIGSVGELTISKGRIKRFEIQDVYEIDGQLKAHVEPHYIVRRNLQPHLYLRDSNFNLSFEESASTAALLYNHSTKKIVDGVIGIDFEVLRKIIGKIGPIKLYEYNKNVNEDNLFEFLQSTIESKFYPGSRVKKDLLDGVFKQITIKLEEKPDKLYEILGIIPNLLEEKHILFAFADSSIQNIFSVNGFSGAYLDLRNREENGVYDIFSINEANIGVNKANILLKRKVEYNIYLDKENQVLSKATLLFDNTDKKAVDYKTYLRIVAPSGSVLTNVRIDGKQQQLTPAITEYSIYEAKNFTPPIGLEIDNFVDEGYQTFGFIINAPKGKLQKVEVEYVNGLFNANSPLINYSLLYFKQPGTLSYPLTVRIHYKEGYAPQEVENASFGKNMVIFNQEIKTDREYIVKLLKSK